MYARFRKIDGSHPFKSAVEGGHVDYPARRLRGGNVVYFNFPLAKEIGLVPGDHPHRLNPELSRAILDTFCLVIINEHDEQTGLRVPSRDRLPGTYMATRYLQLQHPGRNGKTSGDGRSVWNGTLTHDGVTWDISSCGTGVTRLCPATAEQNRFFRTGSAAASYGCGTASLEEGFSAALMSETFHRNHIPTERVLTVIELPSGYAINVRAAPNLLRPSHLFLHLKQARRHRLRAAVDCFIDRQEQNGVFPKLRGARRYRFLAEEAARTFARIAATFEREYIFCWLDWDGDNILADGGIIDYGSVRQFGLYHREYRFDDGPRWSTTITEQRRKARYTARCFAQIRDFLIRGRKPTLASLSRDPVLRLFDAEFVRTRDRLLLRNIGFPADLQSTLLRRDAALIRRFSRAHAHFEHARARRGPVKVADGLSWNAIFSTRDLLRELPERLLADYRLLPTEEFLEIGLSSYASRVDRRPTAHRRRVAGEFQRAYIALIERAARHSGRAVPLLLTEVAQRSAVINRFDRITGDAALYAARSLIRNRRRLSSEELHLVIERFLDHQTRVPERNPGGRAWQVGPPDAKRLFDGLIEIVTELRHGL